ncbi:MAG: T9SS type A sorting domain-containing protein [Bacteroidota bacterium]
MPSVRLSLLALALVLAACDSSSTETDAPDPADPPNDRFRIAVVAETPGGEPVEGLRVAIRPCFSALSVGVLAETCVAAAEAAPHQALAGKTSSTVTYERVDATIIEGLSESTLNVTWVTSAEAENLGFEVQLREKSAGGFSVIGFVEGGGTTGSDRSYEFEAPIAPGDYVLQLRHEDTQGVSGLSDEVLVSPSQSGLGAVFPNPFLQRATVSYFIGDESHDARVEIRDLPGNLVFTDERPAQSTGSFAAVWEGGGVPTGVYVVRMLVNDMVVSERFAARWVAFPVGLTDGPDVRGETDADGAFETLDVTLAPAFNGSGELAYRGENNELLGTFTMPKRVRVTLVDPVTSAQQTYDRAIVDGPNAFTLTWDQ